VSLLVSISFVALAIGCGRRAFQCSAAVTRPVRRAERLDGWAKNPPANACASAVTRTALGKAPFVRALR
jgi:hypothetical protein